MSNRRNTINLLDPIGVPSDTWTSLYNWVFRVGRYLLLSIEIVVLTVFFARFFQDKKNNDLTEEINDKVQILSNQTFRADEIRYGNLHLLFNDVLKLEEIQEINSSEIAQITSGIPAELTLDKFTYNKKKVSMVLLSSSLDKVKDYEFSLRQNPKYSNISVTLSKSGNNESEILLSVSFSLSLSEEENG